MISPIFGSIRLSTCPAFSLLSPRELFNVSVFWRIFVAFNAMSFEGVFSGRAFAAKYVDLLGDGFKVVRVAAFRIPAKVIENQLVRDRSSNKLIGDPVSHFIESFSSYLASTHIKLCIPVRANISYKRPAALLIASLDFRPKAFIYSLFCHKVIMAKPPIKGN